MPPFLFAIHRQGLGLLLEVKSWKVRSVGRESSCCELRTQFRDRHAYMNLRKLAGNRKQKVAEKFDTFCNTILQLIGCLEICVSDHELVVEILKRNLGLEILKELINFEITSIVRLREFVLCQSACIHKFGWASLERFVIRDFSKGLILVSKRRLFLWWFILVIYTWIWTYVSSSWPLEVKNAWISILSIAKKSVFLLKIFWDFHYHAPLV